MKKFPPNLNSSNQESISVNYTSEKFFGEISLINSSIYPIKKRVFFDSPMSGIITFLYKDKTYVTGSDMPVRKRNLKTSLAAVDIELGANEESSLYLSRVGYHAWNTKIYMGTVKEFEKFELKKYNVFPYYIGAVYALIFYNLFLVLFLKSNKYLIYSVFAFSFLMVILNVHGVLDRFDFFETFTPSAHLIINTIFATLMVLIFGYAFLDGHKYLKDMRKIRNLLLLLTILPLPIVLSPMDRTYFHLFGYYVDFNILLSALFLFYLCFLGIKRGAPLAKIYLLSWFCVFGGVFLYFGGLHTFLPENMMTNNGLLFGSIAEMIVLATGLAYQVAIIDKDRKEAEIRALGKERYQNLVRVISHDISNSMQIIIMAISRLKSLCLDEKPTYIIEKIEKSTATVIDVLKSIKMQEKFLQDKSSIKLERVKLKETLLKCLSSNEDIILDKGLQLTSNFPDSEVYVYAEKTSLQNNVLGNIFSNIIKFAPENSTVYMNLSYSADKVILKISDTGHGFSKEALKLFDSKLDMTYSTYGTKGEVGTGFGISIIKNYMDMYQGSVTAFNENGAVYELSFLLGRE